MDRIATSVTGAPVRLTEERWFHITEHHDEMAGHANTVLATVEAPDFVVEGGGGELLAVKRLRRGYRVVAYRELSDTDGFVISAFLPRTGMG